jgi:hypothetical protein
MNGFGTLLFILLTKGKAPAYLGSSFAFLAPVALIIGNPGSTDIARYPLALGAFVVVGLAMALVAVIIKFVGTKWMTSSCRRRPWGRLLRSSAGLGDHGGHEWRPAGPRGRSRGD